jgi:hypothetical protein
MHSFYYVKILEVKIMVLKLSDIEKVVQRKIIIVDGKPQWVRHSLNGELIFNELTDDLIAELNNEVIQGLVGGETEEEVAFLMLPYLVNVENDIPLDRFRKLMESKNAIILMLFEGIMESIEEIFNYSKVRERSEELKSKLPQVPEETIEDKIERLTKALTEEKDTKKKKGILIELTKLNEQAENNG